MTDYQEELLQKLRTESGPAYTSADLYTILLDLVDGDGVEEVFRMLCEVAEDIGQKDVLEKLIKNQTT